MTTSASVCWFDLPVVELTRAMTFYSKVLSVDLKKESFGDLEMAIFPHDENSVVGGCLFKAPNEKPSAHGILVYFSVEGRLDAAQALVEKNHGKVLQAKHAIGPHGFRSIILDSEGNRVALHSKT